MGCVSLVQSITNVLLLLQTSCMKYYQSGTKPNLFGFVPDWLCYIELPIECGLYWFQWDSDKIERRSDFQFTIKKYPTTHHYRHGMGSLLRESDMIIMRFNSIQHTFHPGCTTFPILDDSRAPCCIFPHGNHQPCVWFYWQHYNLQCLECNKPLSSKSPAIASIPDEKPGICVGTSWHL